MTEDQADELVDRLVAGWLGYSWREATIITYVGQLTPLRYDAATAAVTEALTTLPKPPPIVDLVAIYRRHAIPLEAADRRAELTSDERMPEDYLAAGRNGLAAARAILRRAGGGMSAHL